MPLLRIIDLCLRYQRGPLLDHVSAVIQPNERIALLGRNGAGKSSLFKILCGEVQPDKGKLEWQAGVKVARLQQEVPDDIDADVFAVVAQGLAEIGNLLAAYQKLSHDQNAAEQSDYLDKLAELQHQIEAKHGWQYQQNIETLLSKMSLQADDQFASLSGGMKRRVLLARALVTQPDILLLDEPTNHLDFASIEWLETFINQLNITVIFVSHDRRFIESIANRILDLDRGKLVSWSCDYQTYLHRKADALAEEERQNKLFDKKLSEEETWIRQGIKARRTRNEGRVRALKALRRERAQRMSRPGQVSFQLNQGDKSGKLVIRAQNLNHQYDDKMIIDDFSIDIERGDKIGLLGPNGCGKTTLINLLLQRIEPTSGTVTLGSELKIAYFDQHRQNLDYNLSVRDNVSGGSDQITAQGKSKHVMSYLQDFLFTPEQANGPVAVLSGGERNRLLLAKLFSQPANLLVLDEPTNDLDIETLELLEEQLTNYTGTVLIVSHDRAFINNVVTACIGFEGAGHLQAYVGGYDDWQEQRGRLQKPIIQEKAGKTKQAPTQKTPAPQQKLNYQERKLLAALPATIEKMEAEILALQEKLADPNLYQTQAEQAAKITQQLRDAETALAEAYSQWEDLEQRAQ